MVAEELSLPDASRYRSLRDGLSLATSTGLLYYWADGFEARPPEAARWVVVLFVGCGSSDRLARYLARSNAVISIFAPAPEGLTPEAIDRVLAQVHALTDCESRQLTVIASGAAVASAAHYARSRPVVVRRLLLVPRPGCEFAVGGSMDGLLRMPVGVLLPNLAPAANDSSPARIESEAIRRQWHQVEQWRGRRRRQAYRCNRPHRCELVGFDPDQGDDPAEAVARALTTCLAMPLGQHAGASMPGGELKFSL